MVSPPDKDDLTFLPMLLAPSYTTHVCTIKREDNEVAVRQGSFYRYNGAHIALTHNLLGEHVR